MTSEGYKSIDGTLKKLLRIIVAIETGVNELVTARVFYHEDFVEGQMRVHFYMGFSLSEDHHIITRRNITEGYLETIKVEWCSTYGNPSVFQRSSSKVFDLKGIQEKRIFIGYSLRSPCSKRSQPIWMSWIIEISNGISRPIPTFWWTADGKGSQDTVYPIDYYLDLGLLATEFHLLDSWKEVGLHMLASRWHWENPPIVSGNTRKLARSGYVMQPQKRSKSSRATQTVPIQEQIRSELSNGKGNEKSRSATRETTDETNEGQEQRDTTIDEADHEHSNNAKIMAEPNDEYVADLRYEESETDVDDKPNDEGKNSTTYDAHHNHLDGMTEETEPSHWADYPEFRVLYRCLRILKE